MPPLGTQLFRNHSRQYPLSAHHHKSVFSCQKFGFKLNIYSGSLNWMIVVCNHIHELSSQRTSVPELKSKEEKKLHDLKFNLQWFMALSCWHRVWNAGHFISFSISSSSYLTNGNSSFLFTFFSINFLLQQTSQRFTQKPILS